MRIENEPSGSSPGLRAGEATQAAEPDAGGEQMISRLSLVLGGPEAAIAAALVRLEEASERSSEMERRAQESQFERAHQGLEERRAAARKSKLAGIVTGAIGVVTSALGTVGENLGDEPKEIVTVAQRGIKGARAMLDAVNGLVRDGVMSEAEEQSLLGERFELLARQDLLRAQQADEVGDALERSTDRAREAISTLAATREEAELAAARGL